MSFIRALLILLGGIILGILHIGIISALPFPYSEFPLFPIFIALSLVLRVRPSVFWYLLTAIAITDLYRGAGFGVGIVSLVLLVALGFRVSSEFITHRSLLGSIVIGLMAGVLWAVSIHLISSLMAWWRLGDSGLQWGAVGLSALIQGTTTAVVCAFVYSIIPHWFHARSPMTINTRGL